MNHSRRQLLLIFFGTSLLLGCSGDDESGSTTPITPRHDPVTYELTAEPYTALQWVWEPLSPGADTQAAIENEELKVTDHEAFGPSGLGIKLADGLPWVDHVELAPDFEEGLEGERRSVAYIWQSADPQLIDEESPIRFEAFEPLYRPQGHLTTQVFEAHVRSARRISEASGRPFDFAVLAGDLTDGSQLNELKWFITSLTGGTIDPDSGRDDDPVEGPGNDYNDPFTAIGLDTPWYATIGNHETLYNGGFGRLSDELREAAAGTEVYNFPIIPNGFCDGATKNAEVVTEGPTPADEERVPQRLEEVLELLHAAPGEPAGHGLDGTEIAKGIGYFSVKPIPDRPLRLISINSVNSSPANIAVGAFGWMEQPQFTWLKGELAAAEANQELVIILSHHRSGDFSDSSPISGETLAATLGASPNVILHISGHGHANRKEAIPGASAAPGYWELMLASTVDFPMQSRIIELVDEQNGFMTIYVTNLGHNSPEDSLAHEGRSLAAAKLAFGTVDGPGDVNASWAKDIEAQNLTLRVELPSTVETELKKHTWPNRIESQETLSAFDGNAAGN